MANYNFEQFQYSLVKKMTHIMGKAVFTLRSQASLVVQDITYTSVAYTTAANDITIEYVAGGTAGSEVVTVNGNAISIEIEDGVSTATQVKAAFDAEPAAVALATAAITGTAGDAQVAAAEANLAGGRPDSFAISEAPGVSSISVSGAGHYVINLVDSYSALISADFTIAKLTAADLIPQLVSEDVASAKSVTLKTLAGGTATRLVSGDVLYFHLILRNSTAV